MSAYGVIKSVAPTQIVHVRGKSTYDTMRYYQQKLNQLTTTQQYQLLNSLDEQSRYILFQVMNYRP